MKRLLAFEFRKLFRRPTFYACLSICLCGTLLAYLTNRGAQALMQALDPTMYLSLYEALLPSLANGVLPWAGGIFAILTVCYDFDNKTLKNIFARGFSRRQLFYAKLLVSLSATAMMAAACLLLNLLLCSLTFYADAAPYQRLPILLLGQLIVLLGYTALGLLLGFLIKRTGKAVALLFVIPLAVSAVLSVADLYNSIVQNNLTLSIFWLDSLATVFASLDPYQPFLWGAILAAVIYVAIFILLGRLVSRRIEL